MLCGEQSFFSLLLASTSVKVTGWGVGFGAVHVGSCAKEKQNTIAETQAVLISIGGIMTPNQFDWTPVRLSNAVAPTHVDLFNPISVTVQSFQHQAHTRMLLLS